MTETASEDSKMIFWKAKTLVYGGKRYKERTYVVAGVDARHCRCGAKNRGKFAEFESKLEEVIMIS